MSSAVLEHLVAVVTLGCGIGVDDARPMIEEELTALPRRDSGSALDVREVLIDALRKKEEHERLPPVVADLIGEAFIVDASRKLTPAEQGEAVARSYRRSPEATAATVIHTAQDFAEGEDNPATLRWLGGLAEWCETIADLLLLADAFRKESLVLRDRAATVTAVVANRLRSAAQPGSDPAALAAHAVVLSNLSVRLSELGRHEQALLAREESVAICRELPMTHLGALLPSSLNNLANPLGALGRHKEALAAAKEAIAIYRALAARRPDAFRPKLAALLTNVAIRLSNLGCREGAVAASEDATEVYRELALTRPDAFRPDLALSLNNLAMQLSALGCHEQARLASEESVAISRELARLRPDAFWRYVSMYLINLACT